jgi:surface protein
MNNWDVSKVTDMEYIFSWTIALNQDISGWDVSKITNMSYMFSYASAFNQNIGIWNTGAVINMRNMFSHADTFNQDIGGWIISAVTNMTDMFHNDTLTTANYNALLIGWAAQAVQNNVVFSAGNSTYSAAPSDAATARGHLTETHLWAITDGGPI